MKQHIHDQVICNAGTYIVYWFEAALYDHAGKLKRNNAQDLEHFLTIPR
jgi:hypothetical protein